MNPARVSARHARAVDRARGQLHAAAAATAATLGRQEALADIIAYATAEGD